METIKIKKKGIVRIVSKQNYYTNWKKLGFEIVEEEVEEVEELEEAEEAEEVEEAEELEKLTLEEIKTKLEERNIEFDPKMKKNSLLKLLN